MKYLRTEPRKFYMTFNKDGIGGILISAASKKEALVAARDQWGRGAKVDFYGVQNVAVFRNGD